MRIEFDPAKDSANQTKHGVSLALAGELDWETALVWPHSRAFGDGLFELRPRGRTGIGRAFSCFMVGRRITVLHAFIKKTQQTPDRELKLARKRLKELQDG